jgi:hypothetical protein
MRQLKAYQETGTYVNGNMYLIHVQIGEFITARWREYADLFESNCCGVYTQYNRERYTKFLAVYEYPTTTKVKRNLKHGAMHRDEIIQETNRRLAAEKS